MGPSAPSNLLEVEERACRLARRPSNLGHDITHARHAARGVSPSGHFGLGCHFGLVGRTSYSLTGTVHAHDVDVSNSGAATEITPVAGGGGGDIVTIS